MIERDLSHSLEKAIINNRPVHCDKCDGKMFYVSGGKYECRACGHHAYDDFGKVKHYLGEHGPSPAAVISAATGVKTEIINHFLKKGRGQRLIRYMSMKQSPPQRSMLQWVQPRHVISRKPYSRPPMV